MKYVDRKNNHCQEEGKFCEEDLIEMKRIKLLDQKCSEILKEFLIYIVFVTTLSVVTFTNLSNSSIQYNTLFQNTFVKQQTQNEIGLYDVRIIRT